MDASKPEAPTRTRLIDAARRCFLDDDYHKVTTRQIADLADANISMIRYYFGNKEGLYEEMIREILEPLLDVLDGAMLSSVEGFTDFFKLYYRTMSSRPEFPRLILKILALNAGPGRRFIQQLLERGRTRGAEKVQQLKDTGALAVDIDADMLRLSFVSLAMTPMLLKDIFEEQLGKPMDRDFYERLAELNGQLFAAGLSAHIGRTREET